MKKLFVLVFLVSFAFSAKFDFKDALLPEFQIKGFFSHIVYKDKEHRDMQIARLWEKFLSSRDFNEKNSLDKKIYVVYSNYKANAFNCFIGIKTKSHIFDSELKIIPKSNYKKTILNYEKGMNVSDIWDEMQKEKINRNFKTDIEQYDMKDIIKDKQFIKIYLSTK